MTELKIKSVTKEEFGEWEAVFSFENINQVIFDELYKEYQDLFPACSDTDCGYKTNFDFQECVTKIITHYNIHCATVNINNVEYQIFNYCVPTQNVSASIIEVYKSLTDEKIKENILNVKSGIVHQEYWIYGKEFDQEKYDPYSEEYLIL
jgi:hypothetical protein